MPTYEYICLDCRQKFSVFLSFSEYGKKKVNCQFCRSPHVQRKIGRIRVTRSDNSVLDNLEDGENLDRLEENPRAMGSMLRRMKSEMGQAEQPEFDEVINRLESGQSPQEIEQNMPGLGGEPGDAQAEPSELNNDD